MPEEPSPIEYQLFGLSFRIPGAITYFAENLPPEIVGGQGNVGFQDFYYALLDFHHRTSLDPIDPLAFRSWLETETNLYPALGGEPVVIAFIDTVLALDLTTAEAVVAILKFRAQQRKQRDSMQELQLLLFKKEHKTDEDRQRIASLTDQIRALENEVGYDPLAVVMTGTQIAEHAEDIWDLPDFLPTQFPKLNEAMGYDPKKGGFCKGAVHGILAQSGKGKSTLAKCLMNHWVEQDLTVLYVNYEEAVAHWERILLTQVTGKNVYMGATDEEKSHYTKIFRDTMSHWGDRFMVRHDPDTSYFDDLERWLRDIIGHNDRIPDVVIIDTIQSMFTKGSGGAPRWGQFEQIMVRLEKLAKDMHAAIIITGQENSNRMKERRDVVQQSDAGGSLTIIQKAAISIFLVEKRVAGGDDSIDETIMEMQIPKNRITGSAYTGKPPMVLYNDNTKSYESYEPVAAEEYEPLYPVDLEEFLT